MISYNCCSCIQLCSSNIVITAKARRRTRLTRSCSFSTFDFIVIVNILQRSAQKCWCRHYNKLFVQRCSGYETERNYNTQRDVKHDVSFWSWLAVRFSCNEEGLPLRVSLGTPFCRCCTSHAKVSLCFDTKMPLNKRSWSFDPSTWRAAMWELSL